jgi:alpha-mannosidase
MITVHMIGNAHLDPVWLWMRQEGIDAVLATARSACDRLDECPQFIFTCSGSWFHQQVERIDPALFARIQRHVKEGRWQLVGGMHVQPDCNLPAAISFQKQLEIGQRYYQTRFGLTTAVGYNVDSFGHTAFLPRFLRQAGIDSYCFLRPGPHEMALPASVFRWQSPDGFEVIAYQIAQAYCTWADDQQEQIAKALVAAPKGLEHVMCFYGVGDHGGGPTKRQIEWILGHADAFGGARVVMSHPRAYFDAIAGRAGDLPVVRGELQHHAIGCYSVERRIKLAMRRAEHSLGQAQQCLDNLQPANAAGLSERLGKAWELVAFNEFHDILGGTSLPAASGQATGELEWAASEAQEVTVVATRTAFRADAQPGRHRIIVFNPSPDPFDDYVEFGPWVNRAQQHRLSDGVGSEIPVQIMDSQARLRGCFRLLWRCTIGAKEKQVLELASTPLPADQQPPAAGAPRGAAASILTQGPDELRIGDWGLEFQVFEDHTDTWSHSAGKGYSLPRLGRFAWLGSWQQVEGGPLRTMLTRQATFGQSRLYCRLSTYADSPAVHVDLLVTWAQALQMLRMEIAAPQALSRRQDLVSGGILARAVDGFEYPLAGGMCVEGSQGKLAIAAPAVFSASVQDGAVRFTLLRSPSAAWHDPTPLDYRPDCHLTDQGEHEFHFVLWPDGLDIGDLATQVRQLTMPPIIWDVTG